MASHMLGSLYCLTALGLDQINSCIKPVHINHSHATSLGSLQLHDFPKGQENASLLKHSYGHPGLYISNGANGVALQRMTIVILQYSNEGVVANL